MTTSGLASSIPAVPPRVVRAEQALPPRPALFQPRDRSPFLRQYGRALAFSVVLHLFLVALAPRFVVLYAPEGGGGASAPLGAEQGTYLEISLIPPAEIVPLSEISSAQAAIDPAAVAVGTLGVASTAPVSSPIAPAGPGSAAAGTGQFGAGQGTVGATGTGVAGDPSTSQSTGAGSGVGAAAATLRPGYRDGRLYVETPLLPDLEKTPEQIYTERLTARMEAVRDSINGEASRGDLTPDWVRTDGSGNRWGLSDEGLHLGGITIPRKLIPNPRATGDTRTQQDAAERQRQRDEIQRQEADRERRAIQQERTRAAEEARNTGR